ncbi:hypothetical protein JYU34_009783 [Plutella xylostella]|uniref:AB hydrolase-1 domain-containing protein n=1 Tax=Plutella xylostella TaxID=51655 RepID=A0ABQ7QLM1_PLUXY|nr:hypothetical protein JYU34_009783 [Plutella xylostella]
MSVSTYLHHFFVSNLLTLYYSGLVLLGFLWSYVKNPFADPWAQKLRLEPPPCLTDTKYGVHKYIKVNNTKLHYVESGDPSKPLMVFLHGFPEFWYSWRHQITEFNKDYWCIAIDMRGYGDSERPDGLEAYDLKQLVEDVRDLIRQLGREKCVLVAHDWGGLIACRFRDVHPDALSALVVLASTSQEAWYHELWGSDEQRKKSWYVFFYRMPGLAEKLLRMNDMAAFDTVMRVPGKDTITTQDIECFKYWFGKPTALTPPINYYRSNFAYTLADKPRCERPVPFLYALAQNDAYLSTTLIDKMKNYYAHIEPTIIENCGHFAQQEEPAKVNSLIRNFLSKHKV